MTTPASDSAREGREPAVFSLSPEIPGLFDAVYEELRKVALGLIKNRSWGERQLDPTSLVNQAVVRLLRDARFRARTDRQYVCAAAITAMSRILVERARYRRRLKRGGGWKRVPLDALLDYYEEQDMDVLALDDAINRLGQHDERQAQIVTMRYFLGMAVADIAEHFELSPSTVHSDLNLARAWIKRTLGGPLD